MFSEDHETIIKAETAGIEVKTLPEIYRVNLKRQSKAAAPNFAATDSHTPAASLPISKPLATPSPLFPKQVKEALEQPPRMNKPKEVEETPSLLSLSDIGINNLKLPETANHNGQTSAPSLLKNGQASLEKPEETLNSGETAKPDKTVIPEETQKPEPATPIINIIQEPATSEFDIIAPPKPPKADNKDTISPSPASAEEEKSQTQREESSPTVTHSFSFVSQTRTPEPTHSVPNAFIPSEITQEKTNLRLSVGTQDEFRTTVVIHHPIYPSLDDVNKHLSTVRTNFPKLSLPYEPGGDGLGSDLVVKNMPYGSVAPDTILQRKAQRIKKYNSSLDTYYTGIEKYLSDNAEFDNFKRRSAKIDLALFNDLPEDLKSLYISIHFPGNVRVYHDENLPERPATPPPPEEPDLDMLFDPIRLPQVPIPTELTAASDLKMRGRNPAPLEVRWNKGWDVIYSIREIEKSTSMPFNPLYIAFNSFDHATSFRINYRITVASASYEQLGELEIVVRKEI